VPHFGAAYWCFVFTCIKRWDDKLRYVIGVDRVTPKRSIEKSPNEIAYGTSATLPINLELLVYRLL